MTAISTRVDVLVVGYGPVGAAVACLLGKYGVRSLVIDRAPDILQMPRAIALDNEALRILQMAGLGEGAFQVRAIPRVRYLSPYAGEFAQINSCGSLDGHPKLVTFYQPELERALRDCVAGHASVEVATGVEMLGFSDHGEGVCAELRLPEGTATTVEARYLVAADGAGSQVRKAIGQDFRGSTYAEEWLIVDAERPDQALDDIEFVCDPRRPTPHMPAPGHRERWEFMLHPGESREHMEREETVRALLAPYGDVQQMTITRKAVYRFHARTCERFSRGRVHLVGDAAHITPPFVGQGLVAGLRDAANLSWKLAWVLRGSAAAGVLASYDVERRPHAKAMIDLARFMGHLIMPRSRIKALLVHGTVRALRVVPFVRAYFDDLRIKPRNRFREGLFVPGGPRAGACAGSWLPQGLLRSRDGTIAQSDDVLGDRFVLLGCGVDPAAHLGESTLRAWQAAGGAVVRVEARGSGALGAPAYEDLSDALVPGAAPVGRVLVVRPDKVVMHGGPAAESERLVNESLARLDAAHAPTARQPAAVRPTLQQEPMQSC
jgi:3-(3-hydroxy-phenyl)propionate hydroxylase